jgi:hypothetical protein
VKFSKGAVIDEAALLQSGVVKKKGSNIKILAKGEINFPVTLKTNGQYQSGREKQNNRRRRFNRRGNIIC